MVQDPVASHSWRELWQVPAPDTQVPVLTSRVSDPHSFDPDPDPAFEAGDRSGSGSNPDPIRIQDFNDQKLKKITAEKIFLFFFWSKTAIYLSLGLHKVCPSYRRSLQLTKEAIQHFKTWTFKIIFYFCGSFLPSWIRIRNHWPDWIRIQSGSGSETLLTRVQPIWLFFRKWRIQTLWWVQNWNLRHIY